MGAVDGVMWRGGERRGSEEKRGEEKLYGEKR